FSLCPLYYQLAKSCYFSKIFDPASFLPARSLPAAALLALRRRPAAYGIRFAAMPRCVSVVNSLVNNPADSKGRELQRERDRAFTPTVLPLRRLCVLCVSAVISK
ncbi:MAG: hypothetical protein ACR2L2_08920, partial [Acidobacteriota bacterium]